MKKHIHIHLHSSTKDAGFEESKHPQYTKADFDYLKGKGWTNSQITQRWDEEKKAGKSPAAGKGKAPIDFVAMLGSSPAKKEGAGVADDGRRQAAVKK